LQNKGKTGKQITCHLCCQRNGKVNSNKERGKKWGKKLTNSSSHKGKETQIEPKTQIELTYMLNTN